MSRDAPRLFIVSYLDEDVDVNLVPALRKKGFEAYSVRDVGRRTLPIKTNCSSRRNAAGHWSRTMWSILNFCTSNGSNRAKTMQELS